MPWPLSQDYNEAIQSPASNFVDADLRCGEVVANALGIPWPYSGNFADVYQVRCPDGSRWAVKCFTREVKGLGERYGEISRHLRQAKLPFTVDFSYLEQGIRCAGRWYPVLKMHWIEGLTLNEFVRRYLDKPAMLDALLQIWCRMAKYLRAAHIAHCDLQHGNILLVPGSDARHLALKLIDYDGMWVPSLAGNKPGEVGHASYQHPQRLREGTYNLEVDRFPVLLIATVLSALKARGGELWPRYDNGANLLFKETDLRDPGASALFQELSRQGDPQTAAWTAALLKALGGRLESVPLLHEVLAEAQTKSPAFPTGKGPPEFHDIPTVEVALLGARPLAASAPRGGLPVAALVAGVAALVLILGGATGAIYLATRRDPANADTATRLAQNRPPTDTGARGTQPRQPVPAPTGKDQPGSESPPLDKPKPEPGSTPKEPVPPVPVVTPPVAEKTPPKPVVPAEAALAAAETEVKDIYKAEYAKQKPSEIKALAARLLKDGVETKDRPATRFVLLREARDLAAKCGDLPLALRAAEEMAKEFALDAFEMKATALETASRTATTPGARRDVALTALSLAEDAEEADKYEVAERLARAAQQSASSQVNLSVLFAAQARIEEVTALRKAYDSAQTAVQTLADKPDDPDANLALGKFYALSKGDWDRGLSLLARGNDPKLKALAAADLASPFEVLSAEELGDSYVAQSRSENGAEKTSLLCRACYWYEQSEVLLRGLPLTGVTKKAADIVKTLPAARPVVLYAWFGAYTGWGDVTEKIRGSIVQAKGQKLAIKASPGDLGGADPAVGEAKALVVVYRYRGGIHLSIAGEPGVANIPALPGSLNTAPGTPAPAQELFVLHARYGAEGKYADVTAKVQAAVQGATLAGIPNRLGLGEPVPTKRKALVIVYRESGKVRLSVTGEATPIRLAPAPAKP